MNIYPVLGWALSCLLYSEVGFTLNDTVSSQLITPPDSYRTMYSWYSTAVSKPQIM